MLFNSLTFQVFLAVVFGLYWFACGRDVRVQNVLVIAASYVFYGWLDWRLCGLLADGAGASDERVAAVHNEGASPGRELLLPHGGEARQRIEDGLLPGAAPAGKLGIACDTIVTPCL